MTGSLERTTFWTSRLLDFMELLDNALDACEEQGIAPELEVIVGEGSITVADNGAGIPPAMVERLLDFSVRVSSREAYVAPDRGAQGNALKTITGTPLVLDGERGRVDICGGGVLNEIEVSVDRLRQQPKAAPAGAAPDPRRHHRRTACCSTGFPSSPRTPSGCDIDPAGGDVPRGRLAPTT